MLAKLWIHDKKCRILIFSEERRVIDCNDDWNNRASAEITVMKGYPEADIKFIRDANSIRDLNAEWKSCVHGT